LVNAPNKKDVVIAPEEEDKVNPSEEEEPDRRYRCGNVTAMEQIIGYRFCYCWQSRCCSVRATLVC